MIRGGRRPFRRERGPVRRWNRLVSTTDRRIPYRLAAFAATGASVGYEVVLTPFGIVVLAALTAVGGGSVCDLLLARVPVVLREGFYATPAVIGGVAFWLGVSIGVSTGLATIGCAGLVLALRLLALRRGWGLPTV